MFAHLHNIFIFVYFYVVLRDHPRAPHMLGKCCSTEHNPSPSARVLEGIDFQTIALCATYPRLVTESLPPNPGTSKDARHPCVQHTTEVPAGALERAHPAQPARHQAFPRPAGPGPLLVLHPPGRGQRGLSDVPHPAQPARQATSLASPPAWARAPPPGLQRAPTAISQEAAGKASTPASNSATPHKED